MIFTVRQLVEKSIEHATKSYIIFVDLRKAYDSVPHEALWVVLQRLGVPDILIDIVKSFHEEMEAKIRLDQELLEQIEVNNGLRQGCTLAPTLFNLYACAVQEIWWNKINNIQGVGAYILYKLDKQLFRRYTKGAKEKYITESQFADDVALLTVTREAAERAIGLYQSVAKSFGLTVSINKTKFMVIGSNITHEDKLPIKVEDGTIEHVSEFQYLGSVITESGRIDEEIDRRIANASKAFGALRQAVFRDHNLSITTKQLLYRACVLSVLLYGAECWTPLQRHMKRLNTFHHRCIRSVLGISNEQQWEEHISSEMLRKRWGDEETITTKLMK